MDTIKNIYEWCEEDEEENYYHNSYEIILQIKEQFDS